MENEQFSKNLDSVFSVKVRAGRKRTYFFDVKRTKGVDHYVTITESTKRLNGGYERHKVFLYKEDFNRFIEALQETVDFFKTEILPEYDYEEFSRRQEEYEAGKEAERLENNNGKSNVDEMEDAEESEETNEPIAPAKKKNVFEDSGEDMSW